MAEELTLDSMQKVLGWAWDKAVPGVLGTGSATELAQDYLKDNDSVEDAIDSLINWTCAKCGTAGFLTSLGGIVTLPAGVTADIASTMYMQMRMIAAIAYMCHLDIQDEKVKILCIACLGGNAVEDVLKNTSIQVGERILMAQIDKIPGRVLAEINKAVGLRLVTKFGQKGVINLGKAVPFLGGLIGGGLDVALTKSVGAAAKRLFYNSEVENGSSAGITIDSDAE